MIGSEKEQDKGVGKAPIFPLKTGHVPCDLKTSLKVLYLRISATLQECNARNQDSNIQTFGRHFNIQTMEFTNIFVFGIILTAR